MKDQSETHLRIIDTEHLYTFSMSIYSFDNLIITNVVPSL